MARAFVVEWDPNALNCPVISGVYYWRSLYDVQEERRNECNFAFTTREWNGEYLHNCHYLVNSAYEAKVLARLLNQVSNFQIYCYIHNVLNKHIQKNSYKSVADTLVHIQKVIEHLGDKTDCKGNGRGRYSYVFNWSKNQHIHKDIPFNISELDTKQPLNLGPCFFSEQYKMHDENGHLLYLAVMFERKNDGTGDDDLFNYRIKFIGSGQPLPEKWKDVPLYDDTELYRQKFDEYKRDHAKEYKDIANHIKEKITDPDYKKNFATYDYETNERWRPCEPVIGGFRCSDYYYWKYGYCYERHCPHYRGWTHDIATHDGRAVYNRFLNIFGQEIAELVKNGKFRKQHWSMMPDFSDQEFIQKFNKYQGGPTLHFFDDEGDIKNRQNCLNSDLAHVKYWASHPDFDILRFKGYDGKVYTLSSLPKKEIEPEITEDSAIYPPDLKTRLLWSDMDRVKFPAIYMKSPGATRIIESDIGAAYDFVDEDAHIYYDYTDTHIKYKKTKSKGELKITYKFPYPWKDLGYVLEFLMDDVHDIQIHGGNLKWAPSKLFPKDVTDVEIEVLRANVDYNGITVLNPKKMSPIKCDHYEIRESQYDSGVVLSYDQKGQVSGSIRCYSKNIFLFNQKGQVSGVIHTDYVDEILPHIIATCQEKQK